MKYRVLSKNMKSEDLSEVDLTLLYRLRVTNYPFFWFLISIF